MKKEQPVAAPDPTPEAQQTYHDAIVPDLGTAHPSTVEGTEAKAAAEAKRRK